MLTQVHCKHHIQTRSVRSCKQIPIYSCTSLANRLPISCLPTLARTPAVAQRQPCALSWLMPLTSKVSFLTINSTDRSPILTLMADRAGPGTSTGSSCIYTRMSPGFNTIVGMLGWCPPEQNAGSLRSLRTVRILEIGCWP